MLTKTAAAKRRAAGCAALLSVLILLPALAGCASGSADANSPPLTADADLVIPMNDVSDEAAFYPVEIDGTAFEVIAVKAPDGTIRTAFNTCQVCYDSGRGYYKQDGDQLVCQNCGNRFSMDAVEKQQNGCNPIAITAEYKSVDDENITISKDFLTDAKVIFTNWKSRAA
jgi:uncharacterized membrane protein